LQVYIDGLASEGLARIGIVVKQPGRTGYTYKCSKVIGETTNNVAEFEAIYNALEWVIVDSETTLGSGKAIRVYTDSQYSRNALLAPTLPGKNFYLIDSILAIGARLKCGHRTK